MSTSSPPPPPWRDEVTPAFGVALPKNEDVPLRVHQLTMEMIAQSGVLRDVQRELRRAEKHRAQERDERERERKEHDRERKLEHEEARRAARGVQIWLAGILLTMLGSLIAAALVVGGYRERIDSLVLESRDLRAQIRRVEERVARLPTVPLVPWSTPPEMSGRGDR